MRVLNTAFVSTLLVAMSHVASSQDCDLVNQQACCYAENNSGSDTIYCCNGSIVGNLGSSDGASALNDLICCQDDGRTGLSVGLDLTTCRAGSATPLTAKGTAASTIAGAIKSISASRSASRESLFSSASVSRASAAAAAAASTSATSTGVSGTMISSSASIVSSSSSSVKSTSGSSASNAAPGTTSSSSGTAAAVTSSSTSTGGVAMITMNPWNAAMAGGAVLVAAVL